jgi:hypothetical protein
MENHGNRRIPVRSLTAGFNVGRPPQLPHGDSQTVPLAFGFNIPLPRLGVFVFVISIDGDEISGFRSE